jgi:diguanylate cyclase (GGDEF)-like protein
LFTCLLAVLGMAADLVPVWSALFVIAFSWCGNLAVIAWAGTGPTRRCSESTQAFMALMVDTVAVTLAFGLIDLAQGAALQMLCLLLALEMNRLSRRQLLWASLVAMVLLGTASGMRLLWTPETVRLGHEIYNLVMAAVLLPTAVLVGGEVGRLYRKQTLQRQQLAQSLERLAELSSRDSLTGVFNRRHLTALLEEELKRRKRGGPAFCVALLDIDRFKQVNDSHGHAVGDAVLQQFARQVTESLDAGNVLARWGGEEFLLFIPVCTPEQAMAVLARVQAQTALHDWASHAAGLRVSFSAGAASHQTGETLASLLARADAALYAAKDQGRDRVEWAVDKPAAEPERAPEGPTPVWIRNPALTTQPVSAGLADAVNRAAHDHEHEHGSAAAQTAVPQPPSPSQGHKVEAELALQAAEGPDAPRSSVQHTQISSVSSRAFQRLVSWVMSDRPEIRELLRLPLMACVIHLTWLTVVQWYAIPQGAIGSFEGRLAIAWEMLCMLGFYAAIRSGRTLRLRDPSLVLPHQLAACIVVCFGYVVAPELRPSLLHMMCVIQVFGMVTLRPEESRWAGRGALALLGIAWIMVIGQPDANVISESIKLAMCCFVVSRLAVLSHTFSELRKDVAAQQQQLTQAVANEQDLVIRDSLTGLFNRKHMQDLLDRESQRYGRTGHRFCVALIDLDHFKQVNDRYGHHVGDEVLVGLASAARSALRESDVIGRWGGEEFIVLMRDTDPLAQGLVALSRLRQTMSELCPAPMAPELRVTFSAGLANAWPEEPVSHLVERADRALYAAKAFGRNRDEVATGERTATGAENSQCCAAASTLIACAAAHDAGIAQTTAAALAARAAN